MPKLLSLKPLKKTAPLSESGGAGQVITVPLSWKVVVTEAWIGANFFKTFACAGTTMPPTHIVKWV